MESKFSELRFRIELLDDVIQFVQQVWLPSAQQQALGMMSDTLGKQLANMQSRTPVLGSHYLLIALQPGVGQEAIVVRPAYTHRRSDRLDGHLDD